MNWTRSRDDLARYESMPAFKGPIEGAAALAGTLAGAAVSPESWITRFPGAAAAASWLQASSRGEIRRSDGQPHL